MKVFVVSATPEPNSFVAAMARTSCEVMRVGGHEVDHSDLYAMNWNPVASAADFAVQKNPDYLSYALEQRHGVESGTIACDIREELHKLIACDLLILNFPVYWFSMPAILKGWVDRVLVSGQCYGGRRFYDRGGLAGKRALVATTLGGREHMFGPEGIHGPIEEMLSPLLRGTLAYIGFEVLKPFCGWHIPYLEPEARREVLQDYRDLLVNLDDRPKLEFPSLSDYTPDMRPICEPKSHAIVS